MKKILLILFLFIGFIRANETRSENKKEFYENYIIHESFNIKHYFGVSENMFVQSNRGKKYNFNYEELKTIIKKKLKNTSDYYSGAIKAKIVLENKIYFIDNLGFMRCGDKYYKIDIQKLENIINKQK